MSKEEKNLLLNSAERIEDNIEDDEIIWSCACTDGRFCYCCVESCPYLRKIPKKLFVIQQTLCATNKT